MTYNKKNYKLQTTGLNGTAPFIISNLSIKSNFLNYAFCHFAFFKFNLNSFFSQFIIIAGTLSLIYLYTNSPVQHPILHFYFYVCFAT